MKLLFSRAGDNIRALMVPLDPMIPADSHYDFGPFRLIPATRLLLREGRPVALTAKVFDLLVVLVENRGVLLERNFAI